MKHPSLFLLAFEVLGTVQSDLEIGYVAKIVQNWPKHTCWYMIRSQKNHF